MSKAVPNLLKLKVARRAGFRCEYCLLSEKVAFYTFHIDHIKSQKHGGFTILLNLAYCCPDCNYFKGSDLGTFIAGDEYLVRFFNPRKDKWAEHFEILDDASIVGTTDIGQSTVRIFKFNDVDRLIFRQKLMMLFAYP